MSEEKRDDYFASRETYYDSKAKANVVKVFSGDCHVTNKEDDMMVTILGSCIAACVRDPISHVGGMNHFLLPDSISAKDAPLRYGAYSMEKLINDILKMGGRKNRLEVKVFGGGNVIESSAMIGDKNVKFIRDYLKQEGLIISQEDLGGKSPRRIHYYPYTGRVMMRKIDKKEDLEKVKKEEVNYKKQISYHSSHGDEGDVELF